MKFNILKYLEKSVNKYPNKIAVIDQNNRITYTELQSISKSIASKIIKEKYFHTPIIVFMDKEIEALTSFLGIVYSGNSYSLLHPEFPESRLQEISKVLSSPLVITTNTYYKQAKNIFNSKILKYEDLIKEEINEDAINETNSKILDT